MFVASQRALALQIRIVRHAAPNDGISDVQSNSAACRQACTLYVAAVCIDAKKVHER
jgi:hypothetical protein